jgi:hypothetical protein
MRLFPAALLACTFAAAQDWNGYRSGPFEIISNAGDGPARDALNAVDQLHFTLGLLLGKPDLVTLWPVRIVVYRPERQRPKPRDGVRLVRDRYVAGFPRGGAVTPRMLGDIVRLLLEANTARMPAEIERGFEELLSTMTVKGVRVTLGLPPPSKSRDWALMHMLNVDAANRSRARVLYNNLQQGADWETAWRSAFEKSGAEMTAELDRRIAAGSFPPDEFAAKPVNAERDYRPRFVEPVAARLALADLLEGDAAQREYAAILKEFPKNPDALEARGQLAESTQADSRSATAWLAFGATLAEPAKAWDAWQRAAQLNARWGEPHFRMAGISNDPARKVELLKRATTLDPRQVRYWRALAEAAQNAKMFADASRAWRSAERAAATEEERREIVKAQSDYAERRAELEAAERRREAEEKARELAKLKEEGFAAVRAAEARAAQATGAFESKQKPVEWWDGPRPAGRAAGLLERIDCLGRTARWAIRGDDGKLIPLVIRDPTKVVILGGGERSFGCGPQKPARRVSVEYHPQPDAKLGTIGEIALIELK